MFKINKIFTVVTMIVAMAATSWAHIWDGSELDGLWNTPGNWDEGVPNGGTTSITNGDSVTLSGTAGSVSTLNVSGGSILNIEGTMNGSNDILIDGGELHLTGTADVGNNKIKIGNSSGTGTFFMDGGTFTMDDKLEIYDAGIFQYKAGSFTVADNIEITGTFKVVGYDAAGLLSFEEMEAGNSSGTFEFVPNAAGEVTPITMSGGSLSKTLVVDLVNVTAPVDIMLFDASVAQAAFASVAITKDATPLTLGTIPLAVGEYFLDYAGGSGTDVVLSVNVAGAGTPGTLIFGQ